MPSRWDDFRQEAKFNDHFLSDLVGSKATHEFVLFAQRDPRHGDSFNQGGFAFDDREGRSLHRGPGTVLTLSDSSRRSVNARVDKELVSYLHPAPLLRGAQIRIE